MNLTNTNTKINQSNIDQTNVDQAAPVQWTEGEAARMQEMREWLCSHCGRAKVAANDESPLETHKRMWLDLLA